MRNYIVLDLEWNQSPNGKDGSIVNFPFEIIEIGAVKLDHKYQEITEFHRLVRPKVYREIHYKISEVTHMDIQELEAQGQDFEAVIAEFIDWCGDNYIFCTWGSMDLTELQRNMVYYNIPIPFHKPLFYYDVQKLYSLLYGDGKLKPSLDLAVEDLCVDKDRPFHRALDDAHYTGRVMARIGIKKIMEYYSIDYYRLPESREEEIYLVFPEYSKYVSSTFDSKEEAIADKTVTDMVCYQCGRMLRKKIRWFSSNQKFYFALGWCPEHGYMKGKIRMKRNDDGRVYVVKTLKLVGTDGAELVYEKQEEAKKRRNERNKLRKQHKNDH